MGIKSSVMCEIKMGIEFDILESGYFWINIYRNRNNNIYIYEWGPYDIMCSGVLFVWNSWMGGELKLICNL